jgi:hypothetical protein
VVVVTVTATLTVVAVTVAVTVTVRLLMHCRLRSLLRLFPRCLLRVCLVLRQRRRRL